MNYLGDFAEDATVYIPFNTFSSDDPSASVTITNLADADIKVHKDGAVAEIVTDGATVVINFDGITGNHLITIDTSVHADYSVGSDYLVRIEGTTVDGATINAWVGHFSIENRFQEVDVVKWLGQACHAVSENGVPKVDLDQIGGVVQSLTDFKDLVDTGYDPTNHKVQSDLIYIHGSALTETAGQLAAAFTKLFDVATPLLVASDVMRGTDNAALASVVGALADGAAAGDPTTVDTLMQYIKQLINILIGTAGIATFPAEGAPANAVSLAEVIRAIHTDVTGLNGDAMRGTDGANTVVPDAAGTAPTAAEIVNEWETQSQADPTGFHVNVMEWLSQACAAVSVNGVPEVDLTHIMGTILTEGVGGRLAAAFIKLFDVATPLLVASDAMRGTDGANTVVPDAAGTAPTAVEIQAEMEENGASLLDTIRDELANGTDGLSALKTLIDNLQTQVDTTGVALLASAVDAVWDEVLTGATHNVPNSAGRKVRELTEVITISQGTAQAGSNTTITLETGESAVSNFYKGMIVVLLSTTGAGQARAITAYNGTSKVATIGPAWATNPASGSEYAILSFGSVVVAALDDIDLSPTMKTSVNTEVDTALTDYDPPTKAEMDTGHGLLATVAKQDIIDTVVDGIQTDLDNGTDGLGALKTAIDAIAASALLTAEIATVTDQTHFTLATGSDVNDAYTNMGIVLYDDTNSDFPCVRKVTDYVGATKTVTIDSVPNFTLGTDDSVLIFSVVPGSTAPTVAEIQAELEENGASILDTLRDDLADGGRIDLLIDAIKAVTDNLPEAGALTTLLANVAAILLDTGTDGVVLKAAGLNADAVDEFHDEIIEGTITHRQAMRILLSALAGISTGGGTTTPKFRDLANAKNRIAATVDSDGNRTAMTLDGA